MAITIEVNGKIYTGFKSITITSSITSLASSFSFTTTINKTSLFPLKIEDACNIYINNVLAITGFIEIINISYSSGDHSIIIKGRDKTSDIIDSSIVDNVSLVNNISLKEVLEEILVKNNIEDIKVINRVPDIKPFTINEKLEGPIGESIFILMEKYARSRQVLLTTDKEGNIIISRASGIKINHKLLNQIDPVINNNNIKRADCTYDNSNRYNKVFVFGQGNAVVKETPNDDSLTNIEAFSEDKEIRTNRRYASISNTSLDVDIAKDKALWETNIRKTRGFVYKCIVQGFNYDVNNEQNIWKPNIIVNVIDDFCDINSDLLITDVEYSFNNSGGSTTSLNLSYPNSYTLSLEEDSFIEGNTKKVRILFHD